MDTRFIPRRKFLAVTAGGFSTLALGAACGDDDDPPPAATATTAPASTNVAGPTETTAANPPAAAATATSAPAVAAKGTVLVGDVLDHALEDDRWTGEFGFVTFKLHTGVVDGEPAYFIRTDASDEAFAKAEKLVYVPLMAKATTPAQGAADIYLFKNGVADQPAVLSTAPNKDDYTPAYVINQVTFAGAASRLNSVAEVTAAVDGGRARVERTNIVVNYPVVKWPGGEMPVDSEKTAYLGGGQLVEPVDVAGGKVTFKLHACYPASRYIVTDVSMAPMAPMMNIAAAPGADALTKSGATAKILVFGNGVAGSGPMGFQKSVMDSTAGDPIWSPYWDHFTFTWNDEGKAEVVKSEAAVVAAESAQNLKRHPGTPDTNGTLFMVNCPVPVIAPVA